MVKMISYSDIFSVLIRFARNYLSKKKFQDV
jgi:hypothetical protein